MKVEEDWISDYGLKNGDYDITAVDKEMASIIPSPLDMGAVYQRLIRDTLTSKEDFIDMITTENEHQLLKDKNITEDEEKEVYGKIYDTLV